MITDRNAGYSLISREEMRVRLSRWQSFVLYTGLRSKRPFWKHRSGSCSLLEY